MAVANVWHMLPEDGCLRMFRLMPSTAAAALQPAMRPWLCSVFIAFCKAGSTWQSSGAINALVLQVKRLVNSAYENARKVLKQHDRDLHKLAAALLEQETMSGQQMKDLLRISSKVVEAPTGGAVVVATPRQQHTDPTV